MRDEAAVYLSDLGEGEFFRHNGREGARIRPSIEGKNIIWSKTGKPDFMNRMTVVERVMTPEQAIQQLINIVWTGGTIHV